MKELKKVFLFGGTVSLIEAAIILKKLKINFYIYTSKRQLDDKILNSSRSLLQELKINGFDYTICKDINKDKFFLRNFDNKSLGIGFGEPWKFNNKFIKKFEEQLIDFMCIPLPLFRGGAHYTWMSMMGIKRSSICLQEITKNTLQGIFDDGKILFKKNYVIKKNSKPCDFFLKEKKNTALMLRLFFKKILNKKFFKKKKINENNSLFLPRLYTIKNGCLNWDWSGKNILKFINAFDEPYCGCHTQYIKNSKIRETVFLKNASWLNKKIKFHPYQSGLIIDKHSEYIVVATTDGAIKIQKVLNKKNMDIKSKIIIGKRLFSNFNDLELSKTFVPEYNKIRIAKS